MRDYEGPEEKIRRLESELYAARHTILELLPDKLHWLLVSYSKCESREDTYDWENMVAEKLADYIDTDPFDLRQDRSRANCPLCHSGTNDFNGERGFKLPEGLRRHITGYGNTNKCSVMEQITSMAREYWNEEFARREQFEKEKAKALSEAQGEDEPLYLCDPDAIPKPIKEIYFRRDKKLLKWAEARLHDLGVEKKVDGRIISYIYEDGEIRIYANPLEEKRIVFRAYKLPIKERSNSCCHRFTLPDNYKNTLKEKFEKLIREAKTKIE